MLSQNLLPQDPWGDSGPPNWWAGPSTARSLAVAFPLHHSAQGPRWHSQRYIQYEIFSRTLYILFFVTVPSYVIPDCVWHCSCVFKHPVHAVVECHLESLQNIIELKEQMTRSTYIWKRPIIKLIFFKHILINAQTLFVKESDQHHLQYWPQVQAFLKWWYHSNMVDFLNVLSLNACLASSTFLWNRYQVCSKLNLKMFLLQHFHFTLRKMVKQTGAKSTSLLTESICHLLLR